MSRLVPIPLSLLPIPAYPRGPVSENAEYVEERGSMGGLIRRRKENPTLFYGHVEHPVRTRSDWERYKLRFTPSLTGRLPSDWESGSLPLLRGARDPVSLTIFPFFFRLGFYAMGMERFLTAFHEEPDLIHDMFAHWSRFTLETIHPVLDAITPDVALFTEDLAGKNGPLISPRTYAEFWHPHQDPVIRLLVDHGVPLICQWSAGDFRALLPDMMDHGFNCTWPLEVRAGMDALALRARFGAALRMGGNIAKEAVIEGPRAIDAEIDRLLPLVREGGFLPALDDMASPDMPFSHFRHKVGRLQSIRMP
jgi:uroporphyrinogen decarboxylase